MELAALIDVETLRPISYMALISGLGALVFYHFGLKRTPASVATFVELLFPFAAVLLNSFFLGATLSTIQIFAGIVLLYAVSRVAREVS
jgi:drug/metabolite transporter (DMT)-like permease